jgi:iron complex transport system ATP-binding protein
LLKTENISYKAGNKEILHDTSLLFQQGKFHVIMGANGAGKSTLLKILSGNLPPSTGMVYLSGKKLKEYSNSQLAKSRAVLSQNYSITFPVTAFEIVMMGRYPHFHFKPTKKDEEICNESMKRMEIVEFAERDFMTLSGGEQQRVQFARVLAQIWEAGGSERILFLDEAVSHLDLKHQQQLLKIAKELCNQDVTVIAILHDVNLALHYADRLLFMKQGRVAHEINEKESVTPAIIKNIFDVEVSIIDRGNNEMPVIAFLQS